MLAAKKTTATLSAGNNQPSACPHHRAAQGFTLIELLVVLVILAASSAIVAPRIDNAVAAARSKAAIRDVFHLAAAARREAVKGASEVVLQVDTAARRVTVAALKRDLQLPESLEVKITAAKSEQQNQQRAGVRFFADGSATGGRISLGYPTKPTYTLDIDWLTGVAVVGVGES